MRVTLVLEDHQFVGCLLAPKRRGGFIALVPGRIPRAVASALLGIVPREIEVQSSTGELEAGAFITFVYHTEQESGTVEGGRLVHVIPDPRDER